MMSSTTQRTNNFLPHKTRHERAIAPYPPATVYAHFHRGARYYGSKSQSMRDDRSIDSDSNVLWSILTNDKCGWSGYGYSFRLVHRCSSANLCIDIVPNARILECYGAEFEGMSLTDYMRIPIRIWINLENWNTIPYAASFSFTSLLAYRQYLIHHEIGHAVVGLDHEGEETCWKKGCDGKSSTKNKKKGKRNNKGDKTEEEVMSSSYSAGPSNATKAPIMLQQTRGTGCCAPSSCISPDTI